MIDFKVRTACHDYYLSLVHRKCYNNKNAKQKISKGKRYLRVISAENQYTDFREHAFSAQGKIF